jgi:hypothetical protein
VRKTHGMMADKIELQLLTAGLMLVTSPEDGSIV